MSKTEIERRTMVFNDLMLFNGFIVRLGLVQVSKFLKDSVLNRFGFDTLKPNRTEPLLIVKMNPSLERCPILLGRRQVILGTHT